MKSAIAKAGPKFELEAELLASLNKSIGLGSPDDVELYFLAGPNDIVQWVQDLETWQQIGLAVATWVGTKTADEIWDAAVARIKAAILDTPSNKPEIDAEALVKQLQAVIQAVSVKGGDLAVRVDQNPSTPSLRDGALADRGTYVSLPAGLTDIELAEQLVLVAEHAAAIERDNINGLLVEDLQYGGHIRREFANHLNGSPMKKDAEPKPE